MDIGLYPGGEHQRESLKIVFSLSPLVNLTEGESQDRGNQGEEVGISPSTCHIKPPQDYPAALMLSQLWTFYCTVCCYLLLLSYSPAEGAMEDPQRELGNTVSTAALLLHLSMFAGNSWN